LDPPIPGSSEQVIGGCLARRSQEGGNVRRGALSGRTGGASGDDDNAGETPAECSAARVSKVECGCVSIRISL
jgi:hypothetical protein